VERLWPSPGSVRLASVSVVPMVLRTVRVVALPVDVPSPVPGGSCRGTSGRIHTHWPLRSPTVGGSLQLDEIERGPLLQPGRSSLLPISMPSSRPRPSHLAICVPSIIPAAAQIDSVCFGDLQPRPLHLSCHWRCPQRMFSLAPPGAQTVEPLASAFRRFF
jgi:hypothetical protein